MVAAVDRPIAVLERQLRPADGPGLLVLRSRVPGEDLLSVAGVLGIRLEMDLPELEAPGAHPVVPAKRVEATPESSSGALRIPPVQIVVVETVAFLWVEEVAQDIDPHAPILLLEVLREIPVRHQVEHVDVQTIFVMRAAAFSG